MGEFSIFVNQVERNAVSIDQVGQSVQGVQSAVDNASNGLSSIGLADVSPTLRSLVERLRRRRTECVRLADALKQITAKFNTAENNITGTSTVSASDVDPFDITRTYGGGPVPTVQNWDDRVVLYQRTYPYGDVAVNWDAIDEILAKDIEDISEEEWRALADAAVYMDADDLNKLMDAFNSIEEDEDGVPGYVFDADKFNKMAEYVAMETADLQNDWILGNGVNQDEVTQAYQRSIIFSYIDADVFNSGDGLRGIYENGGSMDGYMDRYEQDGKPYCRIYQDEYGNYLVEYSSLTPGIDPITDHADYNRFEVGAPIMDENQVHSYFNETVQNALDPYSSSHNVVEGAISVGTSFAIGKIPVIGDIIGVTTSIESEVANSQMAQSINQAMDASNQAVLFRDLNMGIIPVTQNGETTIVPVITSDTVGIVEACNRTDTLTNTDINWDLNEILNNPVDFANEWEDIKMSDSDVMEAWTSVLRYH